jgi:hypothetical protein
MPLLRVVFIRPENRTTPVPRAPAGFEDSRPTG